MRAAITAEAAITTIIATWKTISPVLPCRSSTGPRSRTGVHTSTEALRCHEQPNRLRTAVTLRGWLRGSLPVWLGGPRAGGGARRSPRHRPPDGGQPRSAPADRVRALAGPAKDTTHTAIATPVHTRRAPGVRRSRTRRSPAPATATTTAVTTTETSPTSRVLDPDLTSTSTPATVAPTQTTAAAPAATTATGKSSRHVPTACTARSCTVPLIALPPFRALSRATCPR